MRLKILNLDVIQFADENIIINLVNPSIQALVKLMHSIMIPSLKRNTRDN